MSKINVFPNTVIQTNGDTPYILKTIERTASLNEVFIESKTNDAINIDMQDIEFSGVSIKGGSEIGETTLTWVRTSKNTQPWTLVDNRILTCTDELKEKYANELQFLVSRGYNIDVPVVTNYLKFTNVSDEIQTVECKISNHGFEYKKGDNQWTVWNTDEVITLNPSEYMEIRGNGYTPSKSSSALGFVFNNNNAYIEASGDVTSLINGEGGDANLTSYQFNSLFKNCQALIKAPNLPTTTLSDYCYYYMFYGCSSLTTAPELPATELAPYCYYRMFSRCSSLVEVLTLSATILAQNCCYEMFNRCSSLTTAPELPATTLAKSCYDGMFYECSNLTTAPELPATTLVDHCYSRMFATCSSLTTAPELPATELASYCYSGMFSNSGVIDAPELPVSTLVEHCYQGMFSGCSSLTTPPELPATELASYCYYEMFYDCYNLTTAPELPATELASYCYRNMFHECSSLTTPPELPATTLAPYCYYEMFSDCYNLTTIPELPATTLTERCYQNMFYNCHSLTVIDELPATELANSCYLGMFSDCWNLITAPKLPATTLANSCYYNMFYGCSNLTTAPELPATELASRCYEYMFSGCSKLNYVKIGAETPSPLNMTNWLYSVASTGTLEITNNILEVTENRPSSLPSGWNVVRSSKPEPQPPLNLTLDLNNEWSRSNITNPDPTNYDMYMSASNWHVNSSTSSMYFVVQSNQDSYDFNFLAIVDAEFSYDKGLAYEPDSSSAPHANIGYGDGDGDITYYNNILYNLEGSSEKRIKVSYIKDISDYSGNDRVFILVPKGTPFTNEWQDS